MIEIRYVENKDKDFWYSLDKHLPGKVIEHAIDFSRRFRHGKREIYRSN